MTSSRSKRQVLQKPLPGAAPTTLTPFTLALTLPLWALFKTRALGTHKVAINAANKIKFAGILAYYPVQGGLV